MLKIATWTGRSNERNDLNVCIGPPTCPPARAHLDAIRAGDREDTVLIHCIIPESLLQRLAGAAANDRAGVVVSLGGQEGSVRQVAPIGLRGTSRGRHAYRVD